MYAQAKEESTNLQKIFKENIENIFNLISQKDFAKVIEQLNALRRMCLSDIVMKVRMY